MIQNDKHTFQIKKFNELSLDELYQIIDLRIRVFVLEQKCIYVDTDWKDQIATHILMYDDSKFVGYARVFAPKVYFNEAAISRIMIEKEYRGKALGKNIVQKSIDLVYQQHGKVDIKLSAQYHLIPFYGGFGFKTSGEVYDDAGIPHIDMLRKIS